MTDDPPFDSAQGAPSASRGAEPRQPAARTLRVRDRLALLALALLFAAGAVALIVHTPPVRRLVLRYTIADVQRRYGIRLDAARLDYNLVALSVGLAQVRIATNASPTVPFFEADYVAASLPPGVLAGSVALNEIAVTSGRVHIVRDRNGRTNLPESSASPAGEPAALEIARLVAPRLIVDLQDAQHDLALNIPGLNIDVGRASGRVSLVAPARLAMGAHSTRVSALDGGAAFDGRALKLSAVQLRLDEGSARLDGTLSLIVSDPAVDLHATGTADVERLARWGIESGQLPRGSMVFDAHASGVLANPVTDLHVRSSRLTWSGGADLRPLDDARGRPDPSTTLGVTPSLPRSEPVEGRGPLFVVTDLSATSRVTTVSAQIQEIRFGLASGQVSGTATLPFDDSAAHVSASWSGIDATMLTTALAGAVAVAPSGTLSGDVQAAGPIARLPQWSADVRLRADGGVTRRGRIAIPGETRLQLADGRWRIDARHRAGGVVPITAAAVGRVDESAIANSTIAGRLDIGDTGVPALTRLLRVTGMAATSGDLMTAGTLQANVMLAGRVESPDIDAHVMARDLAGPQLRVAGIDANISGQPLRPRVTFAARAPAVTLADQPLTDVRASGRLAGNLVEIDTLAASQGAGPGNLSLAGSYDLRTERYGLTVDVANWHVVATGNQPLDGEVDVMFRGAGSVSEPGGEGSVRVMHAVMSGSSIGDLAADIRLDGQTALVTARAPEFNATLAARTSVRAPYETTMDVRAENVDVEKLTALSAGDVRGGRLHPSTCSGCPELVEGQAAHVPITGRTTVVAHAEGPIEAWRDGAARVDVLSLDTKAGDLPIHLAEPAHLRYEQQRVKVDTFEIDAGATRISASGELPAVERTTNTSGADLSGPRNEGGLVLAITGDIGEAARAVSATGLAQLPITAGSGPLALRARVAGSLEKPIIVADLDAGPGSVTITDLSTASDLRLRSHLENDVLELREAHASYEGATLDATGSIPVALFTSAPAPSTAPASLHATASGLSPAVLRGILDDTTLEDMAGTIDLTLNAQAPSLELARATGDLTVDRLDVQLAGLPVRQRMPTRIVAQNGFARVDAWEWAGEGASLSVHGQVRLADRQAAILANGDVDLRVLTPFVRSAGLVTAGRLMPRLSVTGPIEAPRVDGDMTLDGGEVRLLAPRVIVNGLTGRAVLTRTTVTLASLNGSINGGSLTGGGSIEYQPGAGLNGVLSADIRNMALAFPAGLRSELNAMLQLDVASAPGQAAPDERLTGMVTILRGAYREPLALVGGLLTSMRAQQVATSGDRGSGIGDQGSGIGDRSLLDRLALDVRVQTDDDLIVDNNVARAQFGGDLRVIGTASAPALAGRAEIREGGQLFIGRNVYQIESGVLDFANPAAIDPDVKIQASTRAGGEDIEITLSGPATKPIPSLSSPSNSALGQADLTALLLTGKTLDQLNNADATYIGAQVIGNLSGDVLGFAGRAIGLDTLRLGGVEDTDTRRDPTAIATAVDPTSRLTFGRSLGPDVDLTFSQSLRDGAAQTWIVEYLPARRVEVRVVSGDNDLRSYGFRHDVSFGGGGAAAARSPSAVRGREARVTDLAVSGPLAFPEDRIRALLRLRAGDTFDSARWQDDRDRLEDFYHQNGYLAARVTASRALSTSLRASRAQSRDATGGDAVKLSYSIDAGPRTSISVTGVDLDRIVIQRLADAWAESIFDEFLVDEAAQIVKSELAQRGYVQPIVTARVVAVGRVPPQVTAPVVEAVGRVPPQADPPEGTKTLQIDVQPGTRSTETRIRILSAGPSRLAQDDALAKDLDARIAEHRLAEQVVRDPGAVERDLADLLRSRGRLRAKVTAGTPLVEEGVASVPITVDPGPAFAIGTVAFDGARGVPVDDLRAASGLMPDTPYDPVVVDAARDRLVTLYRRRGFSAGAVTPRAMVRPAEPRVDVTFAIQEGSRQMIGDIVVAGNRGVNADVITRAMRLSIGGPLEPEELLRARTRVFETGLFRRVDVRTEPIPGLGIRDPGFAGPNLESRVPNPESRVPNPESRPPSPELSTQPMRVTVDVEAWPALRLRYGFTAAEERPETNADGRQLVPGLSADVTRRTLFGRAVSLAGAVEYQRRQRLARGVLNAPTIMSLPIQSSLVVERSRDAFAAATLVTDRSGVSWEQRSRLRQRLTVSYAYRLERNHTFDTEPSANPLFPTFDVTVRVARLTGAAAWDTRDNPGDTARGALLSSSLEWGPKSIGSDIRYLRNLVQAYEFVPWRGIVFASAARFGVAHALGGQELIPSVRFFAGGARTVRGVAEDGLGGRNFLGDPTGGAAMVILNQEVRAPIYKWLRGVGFVDAGNIFARTSAINLGTLTGSIGVGVRVSTPFVLLRADYGRVAWPGSSQRSGRWVFGIGQAF